MIFFIYDVYFKNMKGCEFYMTVSVSVFFLFCCIVQPSTFISLPGFGFEKCQKKQVLAGNHSCKQAPAVADAPNQSINLLVLSGRSADVYYNLFYCPFRFYFRRFQRPDLSCICLKTNQLLPDVCFISTFSSRMNYWCSNVSSLMDFFKIYIFFCFKM